MLRVEFREDNNPWPAEFREAIINTLPRLSVYVEDVLNHHLALRQESGSLQLFREPLVNTEGGPTSLGARPGRAGTITFNTTVSHAFMPYLLGHELGHFVDWWLLTNEDRDHLITVLCNHYGGAVHDWMRESHYDQVREGFAEQFGWICFGIKEHYYGGHKFQNPRVLENLLIRKRVEMFVDLVNQPQVVKDAVAQIVEEGITRGTSSTTFSPNDFVTRSQMAVFLARVLNVSKGKEAGF
jgi:hypothetical protein